jgi:replication factor C large subunit
MVGNDEVRERLLIWLQKWKVGSKAFMLIGPPGTGKTTTVMLAAKRLGLNLIQLNASDRRTKGMLIEKLGEVLMSTSLFGERTLIFLDEVDGLAGRADYGAVEFIRDSIRKSQNPIVMAANNPESDEVRKLSSVSITALFVKPPAELVEGYLKRIVQSEGLDVSDDRLRTVSASANGDIRAAINSLQGGGEVSKDEELTASQAINAFLSSENEKDALRALRSYPGQPRDKLRDLFNSVTRARIHPERRARALNVLSLTDLVMGRMVRGGNWRLLRYLDSLLASELLSSLGDGGVHYAPDSVPWPLQVRMWNDSKKLRDIAALTGSRTGVSRNGALVEDIPYLMVLSEDKAFRNLLVQALGLEENYALFVAKEAGRMSRIS